VHGKVLNLGYYSKEDDAAKQHDKAALSYNVG